MSKMNKPSILDFILMGLGVHEAPKWNSSLNSDTAPLSFESMLALKMRLKRKHRLSSAGRRTF